MRSGSRQDPSPPGARDQGDGGRSNSSKEWRPAAGSAAGRALLRAEGSAPCAAESRGAHCRVPQCPLPHPAVCLLPPTAVPLGSGARSAVQPHHLRRSLTVGLAGGLVARRVRGCLIVLGATSGSAVGTGGGRSDLDPAPCSGLRSRGGGLRGLLDRALGRDRFRGGRPPPRLPSLPQEHPRLEELEVEGLGEGPQDPRDGRETRRGVLIQVARDHQGRGEEALLGQEG